MTDLQQLAQSVANPTRPAGGTTLRPARGADTTGSSVVVRPARTRGLERTRDLHPAAWYAWSLGLALAASRATNPLLLGLVLAVTGYVAVSCRRPSPWAGAYRVFLLLGLSAVLFHVVVQALAGYPTGTHVLVTLPGVRLPEGLAGVRLGGPVTTEALVTAAESGLRVAVMLACLGAANVATSPARLVKALPAALYEAGLAVTVAVSLAPQTVAQLTRVRAARRLRGRRTAGLAAVRGVAVPVLEGALDSSLALAAALDSRGYGRRVPVAPARRHLATGASLGGLLALGVGTTGVLGPAPAWMGAPALAAGALLLAVGLVAGGARSPRARYRPDTWDARAWVVAGVGGAALVASVAAGADPLLGHSDPLAAPGLPLLPALAVLACLAPAWLAPAPPAAER